MKKPLLVLLSVLTLSFGLTSMTSNNAEYSAGKAGSNGSPGEGTCATGSCHNTSAVNSGSGSVSVNIAGLIDGNMYVPGQVYQVSVTVEQQGIGLFGFGLESLQASGANAGSWTPGNDSHILNATVSGNSRATITHIDDSGFSSNSRTWTFSWTAPTASIPVNMYVAGNAANANGARTGDFIYTSTLALMPAPVLETPTISVQGDLVLCSGESAQLSIEEQSGVSYTWLDQLGNNLGSGASIEVSSAGCYTVSAILGSQVASSEQVCIVQESVNAEFSGLNLEYCINDESSQLIPATVGGQFTGPGVIGNVFYPIQAGPGPHEILYTVTSPGGCEGLFTQAVAVFDLPSQDVVIEGDGITLSALQSNAGYQWINCDTGAEVPGATQSQLTLSDEVGNGNYAVQVSLDGCSVTSDCFALISQQVEGDMDEKDVLLFPNPATDFLQLNVSRSTSWKIFDTRGCELLSGRVSSGNSRIELTSLSAGCYYIQMFDGKQMLSTLLTIQ